MYEYKKYLTIASPYCRLGRRQLTFASVYSRIGTAGIGVDRIILSLNDWREEKQERELWGWRIEEGMELGIGVGYGIRMQDMENFWGGIE